MPRLLCKSSFPFYINLILTTFVNSDGAFATTGPQGSQSTTIHCFSMHLDWLCMATYAAT